MVTSNATSGVQRFGIYEFSPQSGELRKHGIRIRLEGQPLAILKMLLERPGEILTREELQKSLWPSDTFVDFDQSLNAAIKRLRRTLDDSAATPRYLETLAGRGYRFIAPIDKLETADEVLPAPLPVATKNHSFTRTWVIVGLATVAIVLAIVNMDNLRGLFGRSVPQIHSLAVLPLENLSGDPSQEYLADGMTDELITSLARLGNVRVISRTSTIRYKQAQKSLPEIAGELNADAIVEGTVRSSSGRLHVTAQLVQAHPEKNLWAQSYDQPLGDAIKLQEELAQAIAGAVNTTITPQQQAQLRQRRHVSPEAYELYLKGRYFWNRRTEDGLAKAIDYFQRSIANEPDYAEAYSGLADCYNLLHFYGGLVPEESVPKARAAAQKALALDDGLAEAHTSLAYLTHRFDWDWTTAEKEYKRALELNPNYATAHHWYAEYLMVRGRFPEAQGELQKAEELDPLSLEINTDEGLPFYFTRQYDQAITQYRQAAEIDPNFAPVHFALRDVYELQGKFDEAVTEFRKGVLLSGGRDDMVEPIARALKVSGPEGYWLKRLDLALHGPKNLRTTPTQIANLYAALGNKERALAWLGKAYAARDDELVWLVAEPWHDGLRSEPAFIELAHRLGLAS